MVRTITRLYYAYTMRKVRRNLAARLTLTLALRNRQG